MKKTPSDPTHENGGDFATKPYQACANLNGSKFDGRSFKEAAMGKSCSQKGDTRIFKCVPQPEFLGRLKNCWVGNLKKHRLS